MKNNILFFVAMLSVATAKAASFMPPDTLVVNKPNRVTVITTDSMQTIHIEGRDGNPQYNYRNTLQLVDSNYVSTSGIDNDFSFSIGPLHNKKCKETYPKRQISMHFYAGFNGAPGMPNSVLRAWIWQQDLILTDSWFSVTRKVAIPLTSQPSCSSRKMWIRVLLI